MKGQVPLLIIAAGGKLLNLFWDCVVKLLLGDCKNKYLATFRDLISTEGKDN